jgi:ribosome-associated protein
MDDLVVDHRLTIPASELAETFSTSGGPGGQHANRAASRVTLTWDLDGSAIDPTLLRRVRRGIEQESGRVAVTVDESRSQWRNRQLARRRLAELVTEALRPPAPARRPTRPSRSKRRARLRDKRMRGETKRLRRRPEPED